MTDDIKPEAVEPKPEAEEIKPEQVLGVLQKLMNNGESETSRINAAKILLQQMTSQKDDEDDDARQHEAEEQARVLVEARGLLDDLAAKILETNPVSAEVVEESEDEPDNPEG